MADLKQLGIKVEQQGVQQTANALKNLAASVLKVIEPLKAMQQSMLIANDMNLTKLVKSIDTVAINASKMKESLKGINDIGNGFKGITNSFSSVATAAEKISGSVSGISAFNSQLVALRENLIGVKDVSGTIGSIKVGTASVRTSSAPSSRAAVSNADTQTNEAYTASQKRLIAQLEREALQIGKTRAEYLAARADKLGLAATAEPYIAALKRAETQSVSTGMSQKQLANAMRMVPAQFTDIATQLAGGQSPFLIMLQQGGQLRDMFGGFGAMFRNVGAMILRFITNPFVLAAGAIAGVAAALYFGRKEFDDFNKAMTLSGNYSGITSNGFLELQKSLDGIGVSKSAAADALTAIAAAGLRTNLNMVDLTKTMLDFSKQSGAAIGDVVAEYKSLEKDPVQAILILNEKYHFLTASVYQHITSLVKQGEQAKAVAFAQKELERAHQEMTNRMGSNLGYLERGWQSFVGWLAKAKNYMLEIGRKKPDSTVVSDLKNQLADVNKSLQYQDKGSAFESQLLKKKKDLEEQLKAYDSVNQKQAVSKQLTQEDINAQTKINSLIGDGEKKSHSQVAMKRELALLDKQIAEQQAKGAVYSQAQIEAARRAIKDKYEDKTASSKVSSTNTELQRILEQTKAYNAETIQLNQLGLTFDKVGEARKKLNAYQAEVSSGKASEDRLRQLRVLIPALKDLAASEDTNKKAKSSWDEAKQIHEKSLSISALLDAQKEEINVLQTTGATQAKVSENERQSILLKKKAAEATNPRIAAIMNEAAALYSEAAANEKVIKSLTDVNSLKSRGAARQEAGKSELDTLKEQLEQGDVTDSRKLARNIDYEEQKKIIALTKEQNDARSNGKAGAGAVAQLQLQIEYEQRLREEKKKAIDQYDEQKGSLEGVMKAAGRAWEDFIGSAKSSEQDLHSLFSSTFSTMSDTLNTFCTTGKFTFKSMSLSILKNIEEILVKWLAMKAIMGIASAVTSLVSPSSSSSTGSFESAGVGVGDMSSYGLSTVEAKGDAFTSSGISKFAKGGAFTNNIISQPTIFKYAKGQSFGLMGEAGPEAIMPLARTSTGSLGVRTTGMGSAPVVNVQVNVDNNNNTTNKTTGNTDAAASFGNLFAAKVLEVIVQQKRPGGFLAQ